MKASFPLQVQNPKILNQNFHCLMHCLINEPEIIQIVCRGSFLIGFKEHPDDNKQGGLEYCSRK